MITVHVLIGVVLMHCERFCFSVLCVCVCVRACKKFGNVWKHLETAVLYI